MSTSGPLYPSTVSSVQETGDDDGWVNPTNVGADDGTEAQVTAATFDANDQTFALRCSNFGFAIPSDATIDGITVEIDRRCFAGSARDHQVQLFTTPGTTVGTDKATATAWPASLAVATYGGAADTWSASPTPAMVNASTFGVQVKAFATGNNTDVGIDFVRITITYTAPTDSGLTLEVRESGTLRASRAWTPAGSRQPITLTSAERASITSWSAVEYWLAAAGGTRAVLVTRIRATAPETDSAVQPGVGAGVWTGFAPTVGTPRTVTPGAGAGAWAGFALTVGTPLTVTPGAGAGAWAGFALTIGTPLTVTPGAGAAPWAGFAPSLSAPVLVTPGVGAAPWEGFAPTIGTPRTVTPGAGAAPWTGFAPTIGTPRTVTPGVGAGAWAGFEPTLVTPVPSDLWIEGREGGVLRFTRFLEPDFFVEGESTRWELLLTAEERAAIVSWPDLEYWFRAQDGDLPILITRVRAFAPEGATLVIVPGTGAALWAGFAPTIGTPRTVSPGAGAATWTGFAPTIGTPLTVTAGVGAGAWSGFSPTISTDPDTFFPAVATSTWVASTVTFVPGAVSVEMATASSSWVPGSVTFAGGGSSFTATTGVSTWGADQVVFSGPGGGGAVVALQSSYAD